MNLHDFRTQFETDYEELLVAKTDAVSQITSQPENKKLLEHAMLIASGGKRIRAYLGYLSYISCEGEDYEKIKEVCIALELVHAFALFHDDIMDESGQRRGVATIHHAYGNLTKTSASARSGESMAILVGDIYYTWAFEQLLENKLFYSHPAARRSVIALLEEVIHGQILDIVISDTGTSDYSQLKEKNRLKTSSYTFIRPTEVGALLAGLKTDSQQTQSLRNAAEHFGEAFQVTDDLLDFAAPNTTTDKATGKDNYQDIQSGQHTRVTNHIFETGSAEDKNYLKKCFAHPLGDSQKTELYAIAERSGALKESREYAQAEIGKAMSIISDLSLSSEHFKYWQELADLLANRIS